MKKMILSIVAAGALVFTTQTATAQVTGEERTAAEQQMLQQQQDDFQSIQVGELPAEVQQAVERDFQGSTIGEAFVKEKDGERKYKVVVTTTDGQSKELYADAQGNWIDKDKKKDQE